MRRIPIKVRGGLIIFFVCVISKIFVALIATPVTADACIYLDIARNLVRGNGFSCSYNFYQYWAPTPLYYPAAGFIHPLFPLLASVVWFFFHSVDAVIIANVMVSGINALMLYLIVEKIYNSRVAFWSALLVSLLWPFELTSILPWSEQLHLLVLLIAVYFLVKNKDDCALNQTWVGVLLGISYLVRVSSIFNIFIIAAVIVFCFGLTEKTLKRLVTFFLGFLAVLIPYQLFCFTRYGVFYPEYPLCAKIFGSSRMIGGYYASVKPILRLSSGIQFNLNEIYLFHILRNFLKFALMFLKIFGIFSLFFLIKSVLILRKKRFDEILFFSLGFLHLIFFSVSFYWLPTAWLETERYFLIPGTFWIPLVVASIDQFCTSPKVRSMTRHGGWYFVIVMSYFLVFISLPTLKMNFEYIRNRQEIGARKVRETEIFSWLRARTNPRDLIATTEYQYAFDLDRPIVSLPERRVINAKNMNAYLNIYRPGYVLLSKRFLVLYEFFLDQVGVRQDLPADLSAYYVVYRLKI